MKYIVQAGFVLIFGFYCFAQENQQTQVGCDCLHKAGTVTGQSNKETASVECANKLANIPGEEDISVHIELLNNPENNSNQVYECFAIHYVYGFGSDRAGAISNARQTCSALVRSSQIEESIIHPEECKNTR